MQVRNSSYILSTLAVAAIVAAGCQQTDSTLPEAAEASNVIHVTTEDFQRVVLDSDKPVLVDFWATWCGPCKLMDPVIQNAAREFDDKAVVAKVNFDQNPGLAQQYKIAFLPTMLIFHQGKEVDRMQGAVSQQAIEEALTRWTQ